MTKKTTFEDDLLALSAIAEKLALDSTPLEETLLLYSKGKELVVKCEQILNQARVKLVDIEGNEQVFENE